MISYRIIFNDVILRAYSVLATQRMKLQRSVLAVLDNR